MAIGKGGDGLTTHCDRKKRRLHDIGALPLGFEIRDPGCVLVQGEHRCTGPNSHLGDVDVPEYQRNGGNHGEDLCLQLLDF